MGQKDGLGERWAGLLQDAPQLKDIAGRAQWLAAVDGRLRGVLAGPVRPHVRLTNIRETTLVFLAASPVFAAKVRLAQAQLIAAAQREGIEATEVKTVVGALPSSPPDAPPGKVMSPAVRAMLEQTAKELEDEGLAQALRALANAKGPKAP